jgi:hypothetical protein
MSCHICQAEAVTRCYNCGELVCAQHGKADVCQRCATGIVAGRPLAISVSETPLRKAQPAGWWRAKEAEEFAPPACYECKGLTRLVCRNCSCHYCRDHAGFNGLCKACAKSANLGLYVLGGVFVFLLLVFLCQWLFNRF